jgi:hypothetical protein
MLGANLHSVQRILRHSDPGTTAGTYLHLEPGYLRREIDLLKFEAAEKPGPVEPATAAAAPESAPLAAILLLDPERGGKSGRTPEQIQLSFQRLTAERDSGFEPPTFSLGS